MSRVPGAFYIPTTIAQRASVNMPPADGAALRRQLAYDALALVREMPCYNEGWVLVKRDSSKLTSLFRSQWVPFWGELRGGMLLFCDPNSDHIQGQKRQIKIVFTATNCIVDVKNTQTIFQIKIRRSDGLSLLLRVSSYQEALQWCVALQSHTAQYSTIRLADFDWITAIGKGASGKVFLVRDNRTNARLALKVIDKWRVFRSHLTFQHVINERLVLELCSGCPFLIQLRYAFQTDSHLYFATDFYDGGDVFSLLQNNRGRLSEHHARRIIAEIVLALSWLHEQNIVYRDLKPENVVLDGDGHVRLADFGLAKVLKYEHNNVTQTICGTTAYAAPEMLQSKPYDVSLDLWCLGVFIYHILCGRTPFNFKGQSMEAMELTQRKREVRYSSSLSLEAVALIKGLLQNDPHDRFTLEDIKMHPFFRGVDWDRVARKEPHPDDLSRFVSDKEQRDSAIARMAVARAQQLGVGVDASMAQSRVDALEISSMTLDRYLLRNINQEEWRHVSFSGDEDMSATAEFPAFVHRKGTEMETWAIAGWAYTCSEASGHAGMTRADAQGAVGGTGFGDRMNAHSRVGAVTSRRSLPERNEEMYGVDASTVGGIQQRASVGETSRMMRAQRSSLQGGLGGAVPYMHGTGSASERGHRGVFTATGQQHEFGANMNARTVGNGSERLGGIRETNGGMRWGNGKGVLNFGRLSVGRDTRQRASLDNASALTRSRRSSDQRSREDHVRRVETFQNTTLRSMDRRQVKSGLEVGRERGKR